MVAAVADMALVAAVAEHATQTAVWNAAGQGDEFANLHQLPILFRRPLDRINLKALGDLRLNRLSTYVLRLLRHSD